MASDISAVRVPVLSPSNIPSSLVQNTTRYTSSRLRLALSVPSVFEFEAPVSRCRFTDYQLRDVGGIEVTKADLQPIRILQKPF